MDPVVVEFQAPVVVEVSDVVGTLQAEVGLVAFLVVALLFILPSGITDTVGIAAGIVLIVYCFLTGKMKKNSAQPA